MSASSAAAEASKQGTQPITHKPYYYYYCCCTVSRQARAAPRSRTLYRLSLPSHTVACTRGSCYCFSRFLLTQHSGPTATHTAEEAAASHIMYVHTSSSLYAIHHARSTTTGGGGGGGGSKAVVCCCCGWEEFVPTLLQASSDLSLLWL